MNFNEDLVMRKKGGKTFHETNNFYKNYRGEMISMKTKADFEEDKKPKKGEISFSSSKNKEDEGNTMIKGSKNYKYSELVEEITPMKHFYKNQDIFPETKIANQDSTGEKKKLPINEFVNCQYTKIKEHVLKMPFIDANITAKNQIKKNSYSIKELLSLVGYEELLQNATKRHRDEKSKESLIEENEKLNNIIVDYEIKINCMEKEMKKLKDKLTDSKTLERQLNNDLRKERSKTPNLIPSRKIN